MSAQQAIITGIYLTPSEVTALKYNTKQKKILTLHLEPLAPSVFSHGKITNYQALETAITKATQASGAQGTQSIIGFPEDKTFTTIIKKPNVSDDELDQAIYWQAQEVLPDKIDKLYFDWQQVADSIILVSVPKTFLDPIINAVIKAGTNPVSCEPTSLSLSRLAPPQRLSFIAQVRKAQTDIIIVDALGIVKLSAVIYDINKITFQIIEMAQHYFKKYQQKLENLYVCGEGATPAWIQYLKSQTKLQVSLVTLPPISNPPANPTNFASIISLVNKDLAPSKSPSTINLLPKAIEKSYNQTHEKQTLNFSLKATMFALGITVTIMLLGFINIKLNINKVQTQIQTQQDSTNQDSYKNIAQVAQSANAQARILNKLPQPDNLNLILSTLSNITLSGISLSYYTIDLSDQVVLVNGLSLTRDTLLKYKNQLEANDLFKLVSIPLSTLEQSQNIQFSLAIELEKI